MLIKCTSCGSQAKIPDSKEGAKVKCPSCKHVYIARPVGRGGSRAKKTDPTKYFIIGGAALVALVIMIIASGGKNELPQAAEKPVEEPKEKKKYVDPMGWDGPAVSLARALHEAAAAGNEIKISAKLNAELAYGYEVPESYRGEEMPPPPPVEGEEANPEPTEEGPRPEWSTMNTSERLAFSDGLIQSVLAEGLDGFAHSWKPFDGKVEFMQDGYAIVRLQVQPVDLGADVEDRWAQWVFHNPEGDFGAENAWKWISAARWLTPAEAAKMRNRGKKKAAKKTLSDGSVVYESEIRAIGYPDDVPAEEQARLNKLVENFVSDVDARPAVRDGFRDDLVLAGKDSIPPLLTKMAAITEEMSENADENLEDRIRLNWIHETLREITGHSTTFKVSVEMGSTRERIESGIKQWYGWYDRKYKRFDATDEEASEAALDPLADDPDFQPQTERERREYERAKREAEKERREGGG